jgi:hypothetical protein
MRIAGDVPALTLTSRVISRSGTVALDSIALPTADTAVALPASGGFPTGMALNSYVEIQSANMSTAAGDFVLFTLKRAGATDSLAGEIHIIDQRVVVTAIA